jgi:hypothetical protein
MAGRLKGKTDINPQWRLRAMTERFGPCGVGWNYTIDKLWLEPGSDGQVAAFALIGLWWWDGTTDGMGAKILAGPIPGIGGSMLVENESKGPHTSDEAYKMAVTDALSVAMKALGMAADVYAGEMDSKHQGQRAAPPVTGYKREDRWIFGPNAKYPGQTLQAAIDAGDWAYVHACAEGAKSPAKLKAEAQAALEARAHPDDDIPFSG